MKTANLYSIIIGGFLITSLLFPVSCSKQKTSIKEDVMQLQSQRVHIPFDSLLCFNAVMPDSAEYPRLKYRLVVYTDSLSCSSCSLRNLFYWEPLVDSLQKSIDFVFIFSPKHDEINRVVETLRLENISCPIYIDTCSVFIKKNPHIPSNNLMHTFLLNEKDSVVLVGNPQSNPKIKELLFNILEESKQ